MTILNIGNIAIPRELALQTLEQEHAFLRNHIALLDARGSLNHHRRNSYTKAIEFRQAMIHLLRLTTSS